MPILESMTCPHCGGSMVSRRNRQHGTIFWGCVAYPACHGTRNVDGDAPGERRHGHETHDTLPSERARDNDRHRWKDTYNG